jgi:hypothetical protein
MVLKGKVGMKGWGPSNMLKDRAGGIEGGNECVKVGFRTGGDGWLW